MKRLLFAAVAAFLCVNIATAQPPTPKPGPEHEMLKKTVGTWNMTVKEGGQEMKGTSVYTMELGGLWLMSKVEMDFGGMKFSGHGMDTYNAEKKKFIGIWTDSMSTHPLVMEGSFDKDKKTLTMTGDGPDMTGKTVKHTMKTVWTDDDTFDFMMYHGDAKDPMMSIHYTRVKDKK